MQWQLLHLINCINKTRYIPRVYAFVSLLFQNCVEQTTVSMLGNVYSREFANAFPFVCTRHSNKLRERESGRLRERRREKEGERKKERDREREISIIVWHRKENYYLEESYHVINGQSYRIPITKRNRKKYPIKRDIFRDYIK